MKSCIGLSCSLLVATPSAGGQVGDLLCKTFFGQQQNSSRTAQWHLKICCRAQGEHCLLLSSIHAFEAKVMLFARWHSPAGYSGLQQTDPGGGGGVHNSSNPLQVKNSMCSTSDDVHMSLPISIFHI